MTALPSWNTAMFVRSPLRGKKNGDRTLGMIAVFRLSYHIFGEM